MEDAIVIAAEVGPGEGVLADEPITTATLRSVADGRDHHVRILGGPTRGGGFAHLAGHVVPILGARVRIDLHEPARRPDLSLPSPTWVPNTPAGTWESSKLPLTFFLAPPASRDLGDAAGPELDVAARTWGRPACTAFRARFGGVQAVTPGDDGISAVFFHDTAWPEELVPNALAQTIIHEDGTGNLHDADVHVNGAAFRLSIDGAGGTQDIRSVLVHEIGHALGLGHSTDTRATMNLSGSGLRWRSLEQDDVDGVCALYPGTGSQGCDAEPCPADFVCVASACQRRGEHADVCAPCAPAPGACEAAGDDARCVDIGSGATAGRVCARACARDADCGSTFACRATTEAGDLQCVSLTGCQNGANPCTTDADCTHLGSVCRTGACVGIVPTIPDAGVDGAVGGPIDVTGGEADGCACRFARRAAPTCSSAVFVILGLALFRRRR